MDTHAWIGRFFFSVSSDFYDFALELDFYFLYSFTYSTSRLDQYRYYSEFNFSESVLTICISYKIDIFSLNVKHKKYGKHIINNLYYR